MRLALFAAFASSLLVLATRAVADDAKAEGARAEARAIAERGDAAFGSGRCDKAIALWNEAEAKFHAPTILLRIARCQALLGRVVDATASLTKVGADKLEDGAPPAWTEAQAEAMRELPEVKARIASLRVEVLGRNILAPAALEVDDQPTPISEEVVIDPGVHRLRIVSKESIWERKVTLDDGEKMNVSVQLVRTAPPPPPRTTQHVGFAAGAAGLVAIAIGAGFGVAALSLSSNLDAVCGDGRKACPASQESSIGRVKTESLVADVALGGGAALTGTGIALIVAGTTKAEAPRVQIVAGMRGLTLRGSF